MHLPSHGANATAAEYVINNSAFGGQSFCTINQDAETLGNDEWVSLGWHHLGFGASVQLSNIVNGASGAVDIAWDAMAFIARPGNGYSCGYNY